jgi:benzylsuccinate CoA-transferase BbsE subunit
VAKGRTKEALYREAQRRRVPLCPVSTVADVAHNRQLAYRGFFTSVAHAPSERDIVMPGAPFQMSATPNRVRRPAPTLGEHNREVFVGLGVSPERLQVLRNAGAI